MNEVEQLKSFLQRALNLSRAQRVSEARQEVNSLLSRGFDIDTLQTFMCYAAGVDGKISYDEHQFINDVFDYNASYEHFKETVSQWSRLPDDLFRAMVQDYDLATRGSLSLIIIYMLASDGELSVSEFKFWGKLFEA